MTRASVSDTTRLLSMMEEVESKRAWVLGRVVSMPMELDRRRFVPVPRDSYKWRRLYGCRTAVERVNSRLDLSFGFERHFICGMAKMRFRVGLALVVMLAMAKGCPSNLLALRPGFQKTVAAQMAFYAVDWV